MLASLEWKGNMLFECDNHGVKTFMDAMKSAGGNEEAPTPKELLLNAMMGCTAMDVVSILKKMREPMSGLKMSIEVEKTTEHPTYFKSATIVYDVSGELHPEKVMKAVESSMTKYCGVNYMISQLCDIAYRVKLNGKEIMTGKTAFEIKETV